MIASAKAAIARINALDHLLDAFITVTPARAMAEARMLEARQAEGEPPGPLAGIAYALADDHGSAGIRTTCHSQLHEHHVPAADCHVAERLRLAGALLVGKTGLDEFAIGGPGHDLPFPPPHNPWRRTHLPEGASGAAAAVAAGLVRFAITSDADGAIRRAAAQCGAVGLKPSYGRVSRRGVHPLSWSLDASGPLAATIRDAALALQAIAGHDPLDPASAEIPVGAYLTGLEGGVAGLGIGIPRNWLAASSDAGTLAEIDRIATLLRHAGARVEDVALPDLALFSAAGRVILHAEAFALHAADLRRAPQRYGRAAFRQLVLGATLSAADLLQAQRMRRQLADAMNAALARHDALLTAPAHTIAFNLTGHPALVLPTGLTRGLPRGVQLTGRLFDEATLLRITRTVEKLGGWENHPQPPLHVA